MNGKRGALLVVILMMGSLLFIGIVSANPIVVPEEETHRGYPLTITIIILLALSVGLFEYGVSYLFFIKRKVRKWPHVMGAFLCVNLITFPLTHVVAFWLYQGMGAPFQMFAEIIPLLLEPVMFISIFKYLKGKGTMRGYIPDEKVWKIIIIANLVTFLIGLIGTAVVLRV